MKFINIILAALLLLASPALAREKVDINFANLEINDFIELIGKITNKNILVTDKIVGTINLITTAPVYDDEVMGLLVSVLESKGFTMIQNGSVLEVVRSTEAAKRNVKVIKPESRAKGSLMVTQAIVVKGENVDVVAAKVRYLISKAAKLMTMKESNTMLLTDYPDNIETVKKVIRDIDTTNSNVIKIVPVKYAEIKSLNTQVSDIVKSLVNEKVSGENVKVLVNSDINALILVGKKANVERIAQLISELDQERNLNEVVQIFNLKNSDAANVLKSLNDIVSKQTYADPTLKPNISANEEINSLIMVGNPNAIKGLKRIVEELDKEKYQVYVQARIVELSNTDAMDIGVKYGVEGGVVNASGLYTFAGNFGGASYVLSQAASSLVEFDLGNVDQALSLGAALDFLQTKNVSKTVSNPSILCVNNKESSIYVGKTLSFQTGTTSGGTVGSSTTYKREDVGLTLKIKPRVSSNEKVTLDVEGILENVAGTDSITKQPITTKQTVITEAILRHGESIVIGGLMKNYDSETENKLPLLGDIPLLGKLFTSTSVTEQQDQLMVVLTPYVVDESSKLSLLQKKLGELSRLQQEYNSKVFPLVEAKAQAKQENTSGDDE